MSVSPTMRLAIVSVLLFASCIEGGDGVVGVISAPPPNGGPVFSTAGPLTAPGLVSAVAGSNSVHVTWSAQASREQQANVAVFISTLRSELFTGSPKIATNEDGELLLSGLPTGQDYFVGFALQTGPALYKSVGPTLTLHTSAPIFVRADADPMVADGLTPATAFPHPFEGALRAFANGGGNLWIAEGIYADVNLPVFAGVHLFGGFDASFDVSTRAPEDHPSVLMGRAGLPVIDVQGATRFATLDGLTINGGGVAPIGISVTDTPISLRNLDLFDCSGRGIRIRNQGGDRLESHAIAVRSCSNGGDGLSALGPFEFHIERCVFTSNLQEGVDFDDLIGLDGEDSTLIVRGSRFFGNGTQGFDVDLAAPPFPGGLGSRFDVRFLGCAFEHNGEQGLLIDLDFDLVPGWTARLEVAHCTSRANRADGFHLDLDGESSALIRHCLATANAGNGLLVTSETTPALAILSTSALTGNGAYGVLVTLGNAPVLLDHCVLAGNTLGGVLSDTIESSAVACIAHEQGSAFVGVREVGNVITTNAVDVFANIAEAWHSATALDGDRLKLADSTAIALGSIIQIAGDGVPRTVLAVDAISGLRLDSTPQFFQAPAQIEFFPPTGNVVPNFQLVEGSPASGQGFAIPGTSSDAGIFGAPFPSSPGAQVALIDLELKLQAVSPAIGQPVSANETIEITFTGAAPLASSANSTSIRALTQAGDELDITIGVIGKQLLVSPPLTGWPSGAWRIELHEALSSESNQGFVSPVALPLR